MGGRRLIGEVAGELGIHRKTIRYYESIGLIPPPSRNHSGYRVFSDEDIERLEFILRAKRLDFSLAHIGEILEVSERGERPCGYVSGLIEDKLSEIEIRLKSLRELRNELRKLSEEWQDIPAMPHSERDCFCQVIQGN